MATIFTLIKSIDNLDSEYNQKKITSEPFIANQKKMLAELETEVISIGVDNVVSKTYGTLRGYVNESAFDFIVSKMYNKIKEQEEVDSLKQVFQYLINALANTKGTAVAYDYLNKAVNVKVPTDSEGINQKDFITSEFHKYAWLASHTGEEEMTVTMFKYLSDYKFGRDLSNIPPGVDKSLLLAHLKEYTAQVAGSEPGEAKIGEQLISALQSKVGQLSSNNASAIYTGTAENVLLGEGMQQEGDEQ